MHITRSVKHYNSLLFLVDLFAWILSFIVSYWFRHSSHFPGISADYLTALIFTVACFFLTFKYFGLYQGDILAGKEILQMIKAITAGALFLFGVSFFYRNFSYSRITAFTFIVLVFVLNITARVIYRTLIQNLLRSIRWRSEVLIIGGGEIGHKIIKEFLRYSTEYNICGFVDDSTSLQNSNILGVPCLGKLSDLEAIIERNEIDQVLIAFTNGKDEVYKKIINICVEKDIKYYFIPNIYKLITQGISVEIWGGIPIIGMKGNNITGLNYIFKRIFDIVISIALIVVFFPLMLIVAVLIKIFSPGPILYSQERIGYKKQPFTLYKFRSMKHDSDDAVHKEYVEEWIKNTKGSRFKDGNAAVHKITNDSRIIPFIGKFIRKYSIDELPQVINVFLGDMSLVGPRPCLRYELEQYEVWHRARFDCLPGITGLWQVSGRNRLGFDEMVRLDILYLQNWSFIKDLFIIFKTPFVILFEKAY